MSFNNQLKLAVKKLTNGFLFCHFTYSIWYVVLNPPYLTYIMYSHHTIDVTNMSVHIAIHQIMIITPVSTRGKVKIKVRIIRGKPDNTDSLDDSHWSRPLLPPVLN